MYSNLKITATKTSSASTQSAKSSSSAKSAYAVVHDVSSQAPNNISGHNSKTNAPLPASWPATLHDAYKAAIARPEFCADAGMVSCAYGPQNDQRLFILNVDSSVTDPSRRLDALRQGAGRLLRLLHASAIGQLTWHLDSQALRDLNKHAVGLAIGEGMQLANLIHDKFLGAVKSQGGQSDKRKNSGKDKNASPKKLTVQVDKPWLDATRQGVLVGESANVARELAATPPNIANPAYLVRYCKSMAKKVGLRCSIIDAKKAETLGMGGLLAVGRGGSTPPAMIVLEWPGKNTKKTSASSQKKSKTKAAPAPVLLVGKAITFDTGGYSLKPSASMVGMKYDKCGGTAVIGAMHAVASLKIPTRVVAIIATAENMVDTHAYRPNDIITHTNGVTVEITNTDAEGRLVLADALAYGCKKYQPSAVVDLATLTGGVVVALGSYCAGCFCADGDLRSALFDAGDVVGERLWHLPLWDEHRDMMKGTHSDLVNSAMGANARGAHPIQGAAFLSYFAAPNGNATNAGHDKNPNGQPFRWAHLDIAGVSDVKSDTPLYNVGPTGFGVRLLAQTLASWSK